MLLIIKLRLIVMSTNLEYRTRERQRKRESRWEKGDKPGDRDLKREIKTKEIFFVGGTT